MRKELEALRTVEGKIKLSGKDTGRLADYFFKKCEERGIMGSLHKTEFERTMDIYQTYEQNLLLIDKLVEKLAE